jgi:glycosyltransferase involved in cell wall biosynthesis
MTTSVAAQDGSRLRIVISAFCLAPDWGSEPGIGWNFCTRLARWHDVTVVTCPGVSSPNALRERVKRYFELNGPVAGLTIHYVEPRGLVRLCLGDDALRRYTVNYWAYARWQREAFQLAQRLHRENPFDIAHHLNHNGFRDPGFLWCLGTPFVWGPVGGASNTPAAFFTTLSSQDALTLGLRAVVNRFQRRYAKRPRVASRKASRIWVIGSAERQMFERWGRSDVETMLPVGSEKQDAAFVRAYDRTRPLRLVWVGSHIGRKALPIALEAVSRVRGSLELTVVGSGPRTGAWRRLSERLGLDANVRWLGQVPQKAVLEAMVRADLLIHTSIRDDGPSVIAESLSLGLPVVCHDGAAMASAVDKSCGFTVPLRTPRESVEGFTAALQQIVDRPSVLKTLSQGALARAAEKSWDAMSRTIADAYSEVAREVRGQRPSSAGVPGGLINRTLARQSGQ